MSFLIALIKICLLAIFVDYCTQSQYDSKERGPSTTAHVIPEKRMAESEQEPWNNASY